MGIVIFGAGAMGSLLASLIAKAGEDVALVERDRRARRAIEAHGLRYDGTGGEQRIPVPVRETAPDDPVDLALVCVRGADTDGVADELARALGGSGVAVCFQNGVGRLDPLTDALGPGRVFSAWTNMSATLVEAGHVLHTSWGDTRIAPCAPESIDAATTLAARLTRLGLKTHATPNCERLVWTRTVIQSGWQAIAMVAQIANDRVLAIDEARALMKAAVAEAVSVTKTAGIELLVDHPVVEVERILELTAGHMCPMLQDLFRNRPIEVDAINGAIVDLARQRGLAAPIHETLTRLAKTVECARREG
ncbi:MAG: ketopantoate reductase family protein [Deltaproteobacteria bacterium]|nr:ketopantoate reductase family protein [Deltaproteobacteria bacterium]